MNKRMLMLILLSLLLLLSGCSRIRTTGMIQSSEPARIESKPAESQSEALSDSDQQPTDITQKDTISEPSSDISQEQEVEEDDDPDIPSQDDPDSEKTEYSEDGSAQDSSDDQEEIIVDQPNDSAPPAPENTDEGVESGAQETQEEASDEFEVIVPVEESDDLGADDSGETADTMLIYYQTLLNDRAGSLFECQRPYIYWETADDYKTVLKNSMEHNIILWAGAYSASVKLLEDALTVDDGWISRKNPSVIVKCVSSDILGAGVASDNAASSVYDDICNRPGFDMIDAIKNTHLYLISEDLLSTQAGQIAVAVYIAKYSLQDVMDDIDPDEVLYNLLSERNLSTSGIYFYNR